MWDKVHVQSTACIPAGDGLQGWPCARVSGQNVLQQRHRARQMADALHLLCPQQVLQQMYCQTCRGVLLNCI